MRVALDATPLLGAPTGVGRVTAGMLRALAADPAVEPSAFGLTVRGWSDLRDRLPAGVARVGPPLPARVMASAIDWLPTASLRAAERTFPALIGRPDVVHGTNYVVPPSRCAVTTIHDLSPWLHPEWCGADAARYPAVVGAAINRGAMIHTVSKAVADAAAELFDLPADRIGVARPAPDPIPPARSGAGRQRVRLDRYVLFVGTIEPRKNLPLLLDAFDRLRDEGGHDDVGLVIAGAPGWGSAPETLATRAAESPHREAIRLLGRVSEDDRAALLRDASVVAQPSFDEGFGLPPFEALSVGVPVVTTDVGAARELLDHRPDVVITPVGAADEFASGLGQLLDGSHPVGPIGDDPAGLAALGLTWESCGADLVRLYQRAIES